MSAPAGITREQWLEIVRAAATWRTVPRLMLTRGYDDAEMGAARMSALKKLNALALALANEPEPAARLVDDAIAAADFAIEVTS